MRTGEIVRTSDFFLICAGRGPQAAATNNGKCNSSHEVKKPVSHSVLITMGRQPRLNTYMAVRSRRIPLARATDRQG